MLDKQEIFQGAIDIAQCLVESVDMGNLTKDDVKMKITAIRVARVALDIAQEIANGLDEVEGPI